MYKRKQRNRESFWCDENILNLDSNGGYTSESILLYCPSNVRKIVLQISGQTVHFLWSRVPAFKGLIFR